MKNNGPRGYKVQTTIPCCANCTFGGYLGEPSDTHRLCICEIMGDVTGDYSDVVVEPLGVCDAWKPGSGRHAATENENED